MTDSNNNGYYSLALIRYVLYINDKPQEFKSPYLLRLKVYIITTL